MSVGRKEAFETFRRDYDHNDTIEENKQTLKLRFMLVRVLFYWLEICLRSGSHFSEGLFLFFLDTPMPRDLENKLIRRDKK